MSVNIGLGKAVPVDSEKLREQVQKLEQECLLLRKSSENSRTDFKMFQEAEARLVKRCKDQEAELERLRTRGAQIAQVRDSDRVREFELKKMKDSEAELHDRCISLERELQRLRDENKRLDANVQEKDVTVLTLRNLMASLQEERDQLKARNDAESMQTQLRATQVEARERQLRHYAAALSAEKADVQRFAQELAQEIQAAKTMHPLKDYLSVTEFEMSKLELTLKKTPMLSLDRPKLESVFSQMMEQRDFLKSVIEASQKQLDRQAAAVLKIAQGGRLSPVPPLPPTSTQAQKPAGPASEA